MLKRRQRRRTLVGAGQGVNLYIGVINALTGSHIYNITGTRNGVSHEFNEGDNTDICIGDSLYISINLESMYSAKDLVVMVGEEKLSEDYITTTTGQNVHIYITIENVTAPISITFETYSR